MQKKIKILKEIKSYLLSNYGDSVKQVVLFGSQAKGDEKYESDFDVLIILSQDYIWRDKNKIIDLCYEVGL